VAEERDKGETEESDYPASDWHRKSFSIRDRRAQAGWTLVTGPDLSASR
jgi:hypothetical protein